MIGPGCRAALAYLHLVVCLAVPLFYSVHTWRPELACRSGFGAGGSGSGSLSARAGAAADRIVHRLLGGGCGVLVGAAVAYYVLANAWLLCRLG